MPFVLGLLLAAASAPALAPAVALPQGTALTDAIKARDTEFFAVVFDRCEPERLRKMVTDDFEM